MNLAGNEKKNYRCIISEASTLETAPQELTRLCPCIDGLLPSESLRIGRICKPMACSFIDIDVRACPLLFQSPFKLAYVLYRNACIPGTEEPDNRFFQIGNK